MNVEHNVLSLWDRLVVHTHDVLYTLNLFAQKRTGITVFPGGWRAKYLAENINILA